LTGVFFFERIFAAEAVARAAKDATAAAPKLKNEKFNCFFFTCFLVWEVFNMGNETVCLKNHFIDINNTFKMDG
jgi:hypothetical protein